VVLGAGCWVQRFRVQGFRVLGSGVKGWAHGARRTARAEGEKIKDRRCFEFGSGNAEGGNKR